MIVCVCTRAYTFTYCNCSIIFAGFCWPPQSVRFFVCLLVCFFKVLGFEIWMCVGPTS